MKYVYYNKTKERQRSVREMGNTECKGQTEEETEASVHRSKRKERRRGRKGRKMDQIEIQPRERNNI